VHLRDTEHVVTRISGFDSCGWDGRRLETGNPFAGTLAAGGVVDWMFLCNAVNTGTSSPGLDNGSGEWLQSRNPLTGAVATCCVVNCMLLRNAVDTRAPSPWLDSGGS